MNKITMENPIVELLGDEMAQVIWDQIKEEVLEPFIDLNLLTFDGSIYNRDLTDDRVTIEAGEAMLKHKVGIKCASITPDAEKKEKFGLKRIYKSPNGTVRAILDGTIFRVPVVSNKLMKYVTAWEGPIVIARHSYGDIYLSESAIIEKGEKAKFVVEREGKEETIAEFDFQGDGVAMIQVNDTESRRRFARSTFEFALDNKMDVLFSTKDTVSKTYDEEFKNIFQDIYDNEYKESYENAGISYSYKLIDTAAAWMIRSKGNFVWACKNSEGDIFGDLVAAGYGSSAMMSSSLYGKDGSYEYEASHGTMPDIYLDYQKGKSTYANPTSLINAWANAIEKRGQLDNNIQLQSFAQTLKRFNIDVIEAGNLTGDLMDLYLGEDSNKVTTVEFLQILRKKLEEKYS